MDTSPVPQAPVRAARGFLRRRLAPLALAGMLGAGLLAGCSHLDEQQRRWIFQARADQPWTEAQRQQRDDGLRNVWIAHDSQVSGRKLTLHAVWWPQPDAQAPLLLYLHGARRNVETSRSRIAQMQSLGFSVLAVDYRGFGQSTNELPSQDGAVEDALAAWDWLAREYPGRPRYIYGHSLGGAIGVQLAVRRPDEQGLIIDGSFTSIPDVVRSFKWGWLPVGPLITQRFDSADAIAHVGSPVLILHGSRDGFIPPALGQALYDKAVEPKRFVLVEGARHYAGHAFGQEQYRVALREFFGLGGAPAPVSASIPAPVPAR